MNQKYVKVISFYFLIISGAYLAGITHRGWSTTNDDGFSAMIGTLTAVNLIIIFSVVYIHSRRPTKIRKTIKLDTNTKKDIKLDLHKEFKFDSYL